MKLRSVVLAGAIGLSGLSYAGAQSPEAPPSAAPRPLVLDALPLMAPASSQQTADAVAAALRQHPTLRGFRIDVVVVGGVATLNGRVTDADQRDVVRQAVLAVPGVQGVRDELTLVTQTEPIQEQIPLGAGKDAPKFPPVPSKAPAPGVLIPPMPTIPGIAPPPAAGPQEPLPIFQAQPGMLPNPSYQQPPLPPYAWPTYAPYNNYSRVAYPTQYSYNQWPFIGPMYPYPKIPLGWRRVTLEWQDGSWWYQRESNSHDWWRIRYW